ncbi:MAG: adenylate/guanylate cyclase domain-containing protein [Rhodospirillales bacterium]
MEHASVERRLAAIIAADVVGYSRLMGVDEVGTLSTLKAHRSALIDPVVAAHHGRLVKTTGDGLLLEFGSVIDAIVCAVAIQRGMLSRNLTVPEDRRIVYRIGVNIGDVIIDGDDILGDGVNVAARLEALCEPGGICISRAANEQVRDKLSLSFADLGEHTVKNIARSIGVYGLAAKDIATLPEEMVAPVLPGPAAASRTARRRWAVAAAAGLAVVAGAAAWWLSGGSPATAPESIERQLATALAQALPAKPAPYGVETAAAYMKLQAHRAIAIARQAGGTWRTGNWPSREDAEEKALERCQIVYDEPCVLAASDDAMAPAGADGSRLARDMARVRYAGLFNPERIPALRPAVSRRPDIEAYPTMQGAKAVALHVGGTLAVATGAATQRAAEEQALRACNGDPQRNRAEGPCLLYAVGNQVVLPLRSTAPINAPVAASPPASPAAVPADGRDAVADALLAALARIAPAQSPAARKAQVQAYLGSPAHKSIAAHPPASTWRSSGQASAPLAEERTLEGCEARYGAPCVLVAVNDTLSSAPADGDRARRPMPRAQYDGAFDPMQIPAAGDALRRRTDVMAYRDAAGPKAAAFHPWGRLFITTGAATQRAAEEQALAACNADPQRNGQAGPCLLYAVMDQVVLTKRLTGPSTPALAAP